jgi:hypothetical protein
MYEPLKKWHAVTVPFAHLAHPLPLATARAHSLDAALSKLFCE